jgi:alkylated DNA repair dioxygenase AlkB
MALDKKTYFDVDFHVDVYNNLLTEELSVMWFGYLEKLFVDDNDKRRKSVLFGEKGLIYTVTYRGTVSHTEALPWDTVPVLNYLKNLVEKITGQQYSVCVIQRYPNGKIGINPHRDKEMVQGTRICGLSLGAERTISFTRCQKKIDIPLPSGSLYVMNHPTNQKWLHSIVKDASIKTPRLSLTFRDYRPQYLLP